MCDQHSENMIALVTGGYKNLGLEITRSLISGGYRVIATFRSDENKARSTSRELAIEVHKADMSREEDVDVLFDNLERRGLVVGVLINNVSSFPMGSLSGMKRDEFRDAFRSSVFSTFYSTNRAIVHMRSIGWGRIINMGIAGNSKPRAYKDIAAHASAKAALSVMTLSYARELSDEGITVNMVSPGIVDRPDKDKEWRKRMISISSNGRLVRSSEVTSSILELVSDPSTTGSIREII